MDNYYLSMIYEDSLSLTEKRKRGVYYTPKDIVNFILKETISKHDILKNPEPRILDLSCGCGNFLLEAFDILYNMILVNFEEIKRKYGIDYIGNISKHIIEKCIYGVDIDKEAIDILRNSLIKKTIHYELDENTINIINNNIICEDGLKLNYELKFDYIIGNPPYLGHKLLDKEYKKYLLKEYNEVYRDKSDIYFCFYKKSLDLIKEEGKIGYITPRYFMESPSGINLRSYLLKNSKIHKIIDMRSINVFKKIGIYSVIIFYSKQNKNKENHIEVYRNKEINKNSAQNNQLKNIDRSNKFEYIIIKQEELNNRWLILNEDEKIFYNKIEEKCQFILEDIVTSFQGIISGCDKAFVLKANDERIKHIPKNIIKKWIKNKNIFSYVINESEYSIIYSNDIKSLDEYKYIEENCFTPFKEKLKNRREVKNNIRKWYELQWGREKSLFERKKIMYPYKSNKNRFAVDYGNNFASADVYSFYIKEKYNEVFSLEYLVGLLNNPIYDRYFKLTAKDLGNNIYDYYPNKVLKIKIFKDENYDEIEYLSKKIIHNESIKYKMIKDKNLQDKEITFNKEIFYLENESHFLENRISNLIIKSLNL